MKACVVVIFEKIWLEFKQLLIVDRSIVFRRLENLDLKHSANIMT